MSESEFSKIEKGDINVVERQSHFLSWMFPGKPAPIPTDEERTPWPENVYNIFSYCFYWWLNKLLFVGYKRTITTQDLYILPHDTKVETLYQRFTSNYHTVLQSSQNKYISIKCKERGETRETSSVPRDVDLEEFDFTGRMLFIVILRTFWKRFFTAIVVKCLSDVCNCLLPLLQKELIDFVEEKALGLNPYMPHGVGYSLGVALLVLTNSIFFNLFFYNAMMVGAELKGVLSKVLLEKAFAVNDKGRHAYSVGKLNSILGTDLSRIDFCLPFIIFPLTFPVPMAISLGLLISNLGAPSLLGFSIFFFSFILFAGAGVISLRVRKKALFFTDKRVNYVKELLKNFKVIKFYSWENSYKEKIIEARKKEVRHIFTIQGLRLIIIIMANVTAPLASMATFLLLNKLHTSRDVGQIFASLNIFQSLSLQFVFVPLGLMTGGDAFVGLVRIAGFLTFGNVDEEQNEENENPPESLLEDDVALRLSDASFEWPDFESVESEEEAKKKAAEEKKNKKNKKSKKAKKIEEDRKNSIEVSSSDVEVVKVATKGENSTNGEEGSVKNNNFQGLNNLTFDIKKGEFVAVTGVIGSGKSSLLEAISGFMHNTQGSVVSNGSLLLCGIPWVQNATVRDNITFGLEFDRQKYEATTTACSLLSDFDLLPGGDKTEVGERGITLSGGQKARINLARAVYADKDIILMDDVLSAVDARVGNHIMNECIMGLLKDKTRILATHQLSLIDRADNIIFLDGKGSYDFGTLAELKKRNSGFRDLMAFSNKNENDEEEIKGYEEAREVQAVARNITTAKVEFDEKAGMLIDEEERAVNAITWDIYYKYYKAGANNSGWLLIVVFVFLAVFCTFCQLFTNTWLSFWTEDKFAGRSTQFYTGLYVMFTVLFAVFLFGEFLIMSLFCMRASRALNIQATIRLVHTPMSFIDTTPLGRILNRFTKDTDVLDNEILEQVRGFISPFTMIIGVLILCIIYLPWFAIAVPFLGLLFAFFSTFYQATSREVKRLDAVQRSKVYSHFNESLGGMDLIKAYKSDRRFLDIMDNHIDRMNEAYYVSIALQRWLSVNMDILATFLTIIISFLCITRQFKISAASTGLLLSYILSLTGMLSFMLRALTQIETEFNSAERIIHYGYNLVQEPPYEIPERDPAPSWPSEGRVVFDHVDLRYRPGLPLVLKDFNIKVGREEKIGICGRTGAGKSSLMTALYRLAELDGGRILIDDIDISTLGLHKLRSKLSIIPQDPVLFAGSIRYNLDPFEQSSDTALWDALRRAHLIGGEDLERVKVQDKDAKEKHKFHLDQYVEDDGTNFSLGERQLIALARALVRDSKILILDEATSSVDYATDGKIQNTIKNEFNNCTILCIAHRLKTITNYDKILVLADGQAMEFDTPLNLFNKPGSEFRAMCDKSGITIADFETK